MHILISPNAFKNSLNATLAARAIEKGFQESELVCTTECFPVGDGGDGTGELLIELNKGKKISLEVLDPLRRKITASYGLIDNGATAVIEMADASGIRLLKKDELDPLKATSFGTGQLIKDALNKGVTKVLVAMGGSATVDGGTGILAALGVRFLDRDQKELDAIETFTALDKIGLSQMEPQITGVKFIVLCDVHNPLLGTNGAAAIFGPQKGVDAGSLVKLEASLTRLAEVVAASGGKNMDIASGGTAGGAAAGLYGLLNAELANGAGTFLQLTGFERAVSRANLVITGEGSIDEQTLQGKAPYAVALTAKKYGVPVVGFAGKIPFEAIEKLSPYFNELQMINEKQTDLATALASTASNLERTARLLGNSLAASRTA